MYYTNLRLVGLHLVDKHLKQKYNKRGRRWWYIIIMYAYINCYKIYDLIFTCFDITYKYFLLLST